MNYYIQNPEKIVSKKVNKILLIDDNPIDNLISQRYIKKADIAKECVVIDSSIDAYDYLFDYSEDFPEIILLDLNMPMYNGFEFLDKIQTLVNNQSVKSKVYILTSSSNPKDVLKAKSYNVVADYFTKPLNDDHVNKIGY